MTLKDKIRSQNHFKNKTVFLGQREVPEKADYWLSTVYDFLTTSYITVKAETFQMSFNLKVSGCVV